MHYIGCAKRGVLVVSAAAVSAVLAPVASALAPASAPVATASVPALVSAAAALSAVALPAVAPVAPAAVASVSALTSSASAASSSRLVSAFVGLCIPLAESRRHGALRLSREDLGAIVLSPVAASSALLTVSATLVSPSTTLGACASSA